MPYPNDPSLKSGVLELFGAVWPRLPGAIERALRNGADWFEVSTPFVVRARGRVVAHVGVLEMPLRVAGRDLDLLGVHGVCVHPDARGRGHAREALERALEYVDALETTALLWSEKVALYERFGFRRVPEQLSELRPDPAPGRAVRSLDLEDQHDRALLRSMLAERTPVSDRFSTREPGWHFTIDLALWPGGSESLWWCEELQTIVAAEHDGETLRIHDIVACRLPDVSEIAACFGATRVELLISPDRVTRQRVVSRSSPLEDSLMVRGELPPLEPPFALSPLTRC